MRELGAPLALWGGHECTVNRVGDRFGDQTVRTGHETRIDDLDRFAALGLKTLRYPVLWERTAPDRPDVSDWSWSDARLGRLRELGIAPIAGLVHHGSGPRYTHLLDDGFAPGLAAHARGAAERYPWVDAWTPVNEPLTTARFSALYGHWHPHARDEYAMCVALLNQVDATRLAMRAVRTVNGAARLVQTEDLGHVFATDPLRDQAEFENERRWLSFDLLCGRVVPGHRFHARLEGMGLGDRLRAIADDPCPPDVVGVNSYLSSERLIDHRADLYPPERRGGNYETPYADVEAVRAVAPGPLGVERLLELAWERYGRTVAVTECHLGCTREEQMRWLQETWDAAGRLRARGVDVEAVTVWSLLGAVDWNSLLTRDAGSYEPGVFDVRSGEPRPTALAGLVRRLATGEGEAHPAQAGPGWWRRDIRLDHAPVWCGQTAPVARSWSPPAAAPRPVLVTGATGTLGRAFARALQHRGHAYVLTDRTALDVADPASVAAALDAVRPWAVVNAAGYVRVDDAERDADGLPARQRRGGGGAVPRLRRPRPAAPGLQLRPGVRRDQAGRLRRGRRARAAQRLRAQQGHGGGGGARGRRPGADRAHQRLLLPVGPAQLRPGGGAHAGGRPRLPRRGRPGGLAHLRVRPRGTQRWTSSSTARPACATWPTAAASAGRRSPSASRWRSGSMRRWSSPWRAPRWARPRRVRRAWSSARGSARSCRRWTTPWRATPPPCGRRCRSRPAPRPSRCGSSDADRAAASQPRPDPGGLSGQPRPPVTARWRTASAVPPQASGVLADSAFEDVFVCRSAMRADFPRRSRR